VHTAKETDIFCKELGLKVQFFPPASADFNVIDNLFGYVAKKFYYGYKTYSSLMSLESAVRAAWRGVQENEQLRRSLVGSLPSRVLAVKKGKVKFLRKMR
jgi:hypothetical protein